MVKVELSSESNGEQQYDTLHDFIRDVDDIAAQHYEFWPVPIDHVFRPRSRLTSALGWLGSYADLLAVEAHNRGILDLTDIPGVDQNHAVNSSKGFDKNSFLATMSIFHFFRKSYPYNNRSFGLVSRYIEEEADIESIAIKAKKALGDHPAAAKLLVEIPQDQIKVEIGEDLRSGEENGPDVNGDNLENTGVVFESADANESEDPLVILSSQIELLPMQDTSSASVEHGLHAGQELDKTLSISHFPERLRKRLGTSKTDARKVMNWAIDHGKVAFESREASDGRKLRYIKVSSIDVIAELYDEYLQQEQGTVVKPKQEQKTSSIPESLYMAKIPNISDEKLDEEVANWYAEDLENFVKVLLKRGPTDDIVGVGRKDNNRIEASTILAVQFVNANFPPEGKTVEESLMELIPYGREVESAEFAPQLKRVAKFLRSIEEHFGRKSVAEAFRVFRNQAIEKGFRIFGETNAKEYL